MAEGQTRAGAPLMPTFYGGFEAPSFFGVSFLVRLSFFLRPVALAALGLFGTLESAVGFFHLVEQCPPTAACVRRKLRWQISRAAYDIVPLTNHETLET